MGIRFFVFLVLWINKNSVYRSSKIKGKSLANAFDCLVNEKSLHLMIKKSSVCYKISQGNLSFHSAAVFGPSFLPECAGRFVDIAFARSSTRSTESITTSDKTLLTMSLPSAHTFVMSSSITGFTMRSLVVFDWKKLTYRGSLHYITAWTSRTYGLSFVLTTYLRFFRSVSSRRFSASRVRHIANVYSR